MSGRESGAQQKFASFVASSSSAAGLTNHARKRPSIRVYGGEYHRIAMMAAVNRPTAVPSTSAAPNARFHAGDLLLAQVNTIEASRPKTAAAIAAIRLALNI
jgi:hypothetical protein